MTLTDLEDKNNNPDESVVGVGQILVDVIKEALSQERVTLGIFECAEILESCPEQVMLCVLPHVSDANSMVNIQHKLIEAYCWENAVNLVKVDCPEKLVGLLNENNASVDRTLDFSCVLVGFPMDEMSDADFQITKLSYLLQEQDVAPIVLPG